MAVMEKKVKGNELLKNHGGAGRMQMALKYSPASMIIPHIVDQFAWNDVLSNLGVGPRGMKISKLKTSTIEPKETSAY